jgi:hypothetical protein
MSNDQYSDYQKKLRDNFKNKKFPVINTDSDKRKFTTATAATSWFKKSIGEELFKKYIDAGFKPEPSYYEGRYYPQLKKTLPKHEWQMTWEEFVKETASDSTSRTAKRNWIFTIEQAEKAGLPVPQEVKQSVIDTLLSERKKVKQEIRYTESEVLEIVRHVLEADGRMMDPVSDATMARAYFTKTVAPKLDSRNAKFDFMGSSGKIAKFKILPIGGVSEEETVKNTIELFNKTFTPLKKDGRSFIFSKLVSGERMENHPGTGNLIGNVGPDGTLYVSWVQE